MSAQLAKPRLHLVESGTRPAYRDEPRTPLSDEAVVAAIVSGNTAMSAEICGHLVAVVDTTLVRMLGRRESDHDDLVQSALEQILLSIQRGKFAQRCSLSTWAAAIAANIALHAIRKRRVERSLFDWFEDVEAVAPSARRLQNPEGTLLARQGLERVRIHLSRMSERLARTLVLHDVLGCDLDETASLLGASPVATQSRLSRARRELAKRLAGDDKRHKESP